MGVSKQSVFKSIILMILKFVVLLLIQYYTQKFDNRRQFLNFVFKSGLTRGDLLVNEKRILVCLYRVANGYIKQNRYYN